MTPKLSRWAAVCVLALCPTALVVAADRRPPASDATAVRPATASRRPATKAAPRGTSSVRPATATSAKPRPTSEAHGAAPRRTTASKAKKSPPEAQLTSATTRRTRTVHRQPTPPPDELMPTDDQPTEALPSDGQELAPPEAPARKLTPIPQAAPETYEGEMIYEDGSFCEDECCDIPCGTPGCGGFIAGYDFVFLQANFSDNPGFYRTQTNGQLFNQTDEQLKYDPKLSSRVWFGYQHASGLGARARYFLFDQNSQNVAGTASFDTALEAPFMPGNQGGFRSPVTTAAGDQFTAGSGLSVQAVDLEGTKRVSFGTWSLMASGGFRYGVVKQNYNAQIRDAQGLLDSTAQYGHRFEGFGPQFALEARRQVTSRIALFSAARLAILFGHGSGQLTIAEGLQNSVRDYTLTRSRRSDLLPIAELQVGADYLTNFHVGTARLVCRGALEAQWYQGAGNATSENGDLALVGGSFSIGLNY